MRRLNLGEGRDNDDAALRQRPIGRGEAGRVRGQYLSVGVLVVLVVAGVVILLDEAEVFLPLPLERALSPLRVRREVALRG